MYERLVTSRRGSALLLVGPVAIVSLFVGVISTAPYAFIGPQRVLPWMDARVILAAGTICAIISTAGVAVLVARILVGVGLVGVLYGRPTQHGGQLATFSGRIGLPWTRSRTIELTRGHPVTIRAFGDPPWGRVMQLQGLVITDGSSTLQTTCFVGFTAQSRATLTDWLERNGLAAEITGDETVLPVGAGSQP